MYPLRTKVLNDVSVQQKSGCIGLSSLKCQPEVNLLQACAISEFFTVVWFVFLLYDFMDHSSHFSPFRSRL